MKRVLFLLTIGLLLAVPTFAASRIVPVAGHGPGANNTFWTTDLQITNRSSQTQAIHLTFHPGGRADVSRDVTLAGNASVLLADVVAPSSFGVSPDTSWLGELEIESPGDLSATAHTFTRSSDGIGTFGSVSDSLDPSLLPTHGSVTGILVDDRYRSNIALTNGGVTPVTIHFDLRRRDGSAAASDDVTVGAHQTLQPSAGSYVHGADDSPLSLHWSASGPAYVVASVVDNRSGDPSESRSISSPGTSLFFPLVGKTPGANGTFWTTAVSITNTEDRAGQATLEYQGNDGVHVSKTVTLQPLGTFQSDDVFQFLGLGSGSGFLTVTTSVEVNAAARVFNTREDGGTFGSTLLPQDRVSHSALVEVRGVRRDDDFRLNVAIANDGSVDADGAIRLFDESNGELENQHFHVPARSALQFAINKVSTNVRAGRIEVETEHGVEVTVIASNVDNRSGDTVVSETEQENERQQELEIRMSAKSAAAGVPITFTAVTPSGMQVSSIHWDFGDGTSATGSAATHAFASGGEFKVTMTVLLATGSTLRKAEDVKITGAGGGGATGLDFSWSPSAPQAGQAVTFTAMIMGNASAGAFVKWKIEGVTSTGLTVTHTFSTAGSFEVEAELEQEGANSMQVTHNVNVGTGTPNPGTTTLDFSWSPSSPIAGQTVSFTATVTGTPVSDSEIKWRMPDNSRPLGAHATFKFTSPGSYSVEVELEHAGVSLQRQKTVTVH